jgi:inner membrane protein involved in colicin E2 resistance
MEIAFIVLTISLLIVILVTVLLMSVLVLERTRNLAVMQVQIDRIEDSVLNSQQSFDPFANAPFLDFKVGNSTDLKNFFEENTEEDDQDDWNKE